MRKPGAVLVPLGLARTKASRIRRGLSRIHGIPYRRRSQTPPNLLAILLNPLDRNLAFRQFDEVRVWSHRVIDGSVSFIYFSKPHEVLKWHPVIARSTHPDSKQTFDL